VGIPGPLDAAQELGLICLGDDGGLLLQVVRDHRLQVGVQHVSLLVQHEVVRISTPQR